ncbi:MAG TPA: hypothetical protein VLA49_12645 [Anaerolineales bacterium]|nr:hypothetical protein [Anaerolineales bacterium]
MSISIEARCLVYDFASELSQVEPDPSKWAPHLLVLLKRLEDEAGKLDRVDAIKNTYAELCNELNVRLEARV